MDINKTLSERQKTHGTFSRNAGMYMALKTAANIDGNIQFPTQISADKVISDYTDLDVARTGLTYILLKIARILTGNWKEVDHWRDIAGYATLVARRLAGESEYEANGPQVDKT